MLANMIHHGSSQARQVLNEKARTVSAQLVNTTCSLPKTENAIKFPNAVPSDNPLPKLQGLTLCWLYLLAEQSDWSSKPL